MPVISLNATIQLHTYVIPATNPTTVISTVRLVSANSVTRLNQVTLNVTVSRIPLATQMLKVAHPNLEISLDPCLPPLPLLLIISNYPSTIGADDIEAIVRQVLSSSGTPPSTALSVTTGCSSWFFDSSCCNHMTSDPNIFSSRTPASNILTIHTADGAPMHVTHTGLVSTFTLSLANTYLIPKLTLNPISIGQLCGLGLTVLFSSSGCLVQDPRMGTTLGISRKQGHLFELIHLRIPSHISTPVRSAASTSTTSSLVLWHSRLGHVSFDHLRLLVSSGQLGSVQNEKVDCLLCHLAK